MRLQGAIFDMDGTLLDSMPAWNGVTERLLRDLGREPEPDLAEQLKALSPHQGAAYCKEHYGLSQTVEELVAAVNSLVHDAYAHTIQPKPDVEKFLSLLKMEGVWMYVATATDRAEAEVALRRTGLDRFFRGIMTCAEAGAGKDDPRIYERCLTRLRCQKRDCVVFEDSLHAVRTAKAAGFRVAAVYDAFSEGDQPELRRLADYYLPSYGAWLETETL